MLLIFYISELMMQLYKWSCTILVSINKSVLGANINAIVKNAFSIAKYAYSSAHKACLGLSCQNLWIRINNWACSGRLELCKRAVLLCLFASINMQIILLGNCLDPAFLFVHGLGGNKLQVNRYIDAEIISNNCASFNFKDVSKRRLFKYNIVNLAQEFDIEQLNTQYEQIVEEKVLKNGHNGIILFGVSRGAATVLNFLAHKKPSNVKAAIIECPFDAVCNIVEYQLKNLSMHWIPGLKNSLHKAIKSWLFPSYILDGIQPINCVSLISRDIPILLIHSQQDQFIGINSSRALYCALCKQGHNEVYLVELTQGKHARCLSNEEGICFRGVVHAFYKRHGLPYKALYSNQGEGILRKARPSVEEVEQRMLLN